MQQILRANSRFIRNQMHNNIYHDRISEDTRDFMHNLRSIYLGVMKLL